MATGQEDLTTESGLDRRALIKRAALVGAAAWTAPIVIESLASPAGALTAGCFRVLVNNDSTCSIGAYTVSGTCEPTIASACLNPGDSKVGDTLATFSLTSTGGGCNQNGQDIVFNVASPCVFLGASGTKAGTCQRNGGTDVTFSNANRTVTFTKGAWSGGFRLIISC